MRITFSILGKLIISGLSLIGLLALFDFYKDNKVTELDLVYNELKNKPIVESFGLIASVNYGGYAKVWLIDNGFIEFEFASSRVMNEETAGLIHQIGSYQLKCKSEEYGDAVSPHFDQLEELLDMDGQFSLSKVLDSYDIVLLAVNKLPDKVVSKSTDSTAPQCWKEPAVVQNFYMFPPINIKRQVFTRKASPICPTFLRFRLCSQ